MAPVVALEVENISLNDKDEEKEKQEENKIKEVESVSRPTIGIIYPPPEVRSPEFEERIRANEANNPKFNFLNPNDPYHAYYQHKKKEFHENDQQGITPAAPKAAPSQQTTQIKQIKQAVPQVTEPVVPKEPPPDFEFIADPPSISAIDLDIVKLTAQFVAKNGRTFLTNLINREQRNYQFDFLRPQHSLFQYFTKLVEQYTKVLLPPSDLDKKLKGNVDDPFKVYDIVQHRVEWARYQERERRKEEEERERERVAFAQVDWHDFVVVETVNFREDEIANLPPPVTLEQLGARILAQERFERMQETGEINAEEMEMEVEDDEEENGIETGIDKSSATRDSNRPPSPPHPPSAEMKQPPLPPTAPGPNVNIRRDYDPKAPKPPPPSSAPPPDKYLISPLTGEKVPAEAMAEHMKINLLDPRWKELKQRAADEKRQQEQMFAEGVSVGSTLKDLAQYRPDIFGVGAEEIMIGKKAGDEDKRGDKVVWDGHTASMERATKLAQANITLEEQIEAIHKAKGLIATDDEGKIGPSVPKPPEATDFGYRPQPPQMSTHGEPPKRPEPPRQPEPPPLIQPPPLLPTSKQGNPLGDHHPPSMGLPPPPILPPPVPPLVMQPPIPPPNVKPGLLGLAPGQAPPGVPMPPVPLPQGLPQPIPPPQLPDSLQEDRSDEPYAKRSRMDGDNELMGEQEFLATHPSPVTFKVQVPEMREKTEWRCHGQALMFTLPLTDQISVIKAKVHDATGMPAGKQKLQIETMFIKDSNTLAFYNFTSNTVVGLQLKERGGRKK
eukprot:gene12737-3463_t